MIFKQLSRRQFTILTGRLFAALAAFFSFPGRAASSTGSETFSELQAKISGDVITKNLGNYADLLWAARGSGANPLALEEASPRSRSMTCSTSSIFLSVHAGLQPIRFALISPYGQSWKNTIPMGYFILILVMADLDISPSYA